MMSSCSGPSNPALYRVTDGSQGRAATRWLLRTDVWEKEGGSENLKDISVAERV